MIPLFSSTNLRYALLAAAILITSSCTDEPASESGDIPGLKDYFEDAFYMGTALNANQIFGQDEAGIALTLQEFNALTPENIMKWEEIHPEPGLYNWEAADRFVEFGNANDMYMTGHTLVWHSQTPDWVFEDENGNPLEREALIERMRDHIFEVVGRYKGEVHSWDVVNEALNEDGSMRETPWYNIIGKEYLLHAFRFAAEADPEARLYYNDYSLEGAPKRQGAIELVQYLQENEVPIHGIGTQGHYSLDWPTSEELRATLTQFADLGIDVMVTELEIDVLPPAMDYMGADVNINIEMREELDPYADGLPAEVEAELNKRYAHIFEIFMEHHQDIHRVTFWGVQDGDSWKNNWPVQGRTNYPLLFDRDHERKPAYDSVVQAAM